MNGKKVYIKTYGCQMNVHESEKMYAQFEKEGFTFAESMNTADIIVFNTCCIREGAETRVIGNLGIAKKLKEKNRNLIIAICGCMTQQSGMAEYLHSRCPFVNVITGTFGVGKIVDYIKLAGNSYFSDICIDESIPHGINEAKRSGEANNYVNIMYGCDNFCTYCIVPYVKGRERSRRLIDIKNEVAELISHGAKEITLLGQNVNSFRDEDGNDFFALLSSLSHLDGDYWIKFLTSHPKDLSEEAIKLIGSEEKLANYVHLPLQSGSDKILSEMNRKYSVKEYLKKIEWIKKYIPDAGITSDVIIGFPGETDEDFEQTMSLTKDIEFNNLFMFLYSIRKGTPAAEMQNQVPESIKKERIARLIKQQSKIENELAKQHVGKTLKVLCDNDSEGKFSAKSGNDKPIIIENGKKGMLNRFFEVKITQAVGSKLYGNIK